MQGDKQGPVVSERARQWMSGELDTETYFRECYEEERVYAEQQIKQELERRRRLRAAAPQEVIVDPELTERGLLRSLIAKVSRRA